MDARRATCALAVVLLGLAGVSVPTGAVAVDHVLITAVYYDTYVNGEGDEFIRLTNPTAADVDLGGWKLRDRQDDSITFPTDAGATLPAGGSIYLTGKALDFVKDMVVTADWEYRANTDGTPDMTRTGSFTLSNTGDEVRLYNAANALVDAVGWVNAPAVGWSGAALADVSEGDILERDTDESTGDHPDTDTLADWDDTRIYVVGQSRFAPASFEATQATMFSSPDSSFDVVADFIDRAEQSLGISVYELTNTHIGDAILERCEAGVPVRLLLEGGPAGFAEESRKQENWILDRIDGTQDCEVRFMYTNDTLEVHDRYSYLHAKFALADGHHTLSMSGNWKTTGLPKDPTYGNREWGVAVHSEGLHAYLLDVFEDDWDAAHRDILPFGEGDDWRYLPPPEDFEPNTTVPVGTYAPYFPSKDLRTTFTVRPVLSPDTSTRENDSLRELLRNAQSEILIEQMYAHKHWGPTATGSPEANPNLFLEAAIEAARNNGATVYVLLGDEYIVDEDTRNNEETVDYLRQIAQDEGLDIHAKLVNKTIAELVKVHNKGVVVDRSAAVVSSINWGRASAQDNREVALILEDPEIAEFYRDIFWYDWSPQLYKPITDLTVTDLQVRPLPLVVPWPGLPIPSPVPLPALPYPQPPVDDPTRHLVEVTIANVGNYGAGDFDVTVTATPDTQGPELLAAEWRVNDLARGASLTLSTVWKWDGCMRAGAIAFTAIVDSSSEVRELEEGNNTMKRFFDLVAPIPGVTHCADLALEKGEGLPPVPRP